MLSRHPLYYSRLIPRINTFPPSLLVFSPAGAPPRTQLRYQLSARTRQLVSSLPDFVFHSTAAFIIDMRMTDWEAGQAVRARLEPLGRTGLSIIYADKSKPMIAIKAAGFWLDGEMYDHAALAKNASETFKREAAIYEALGPHPHILNVWAQHTCEPERRQTQRRGKPGQCDSRGPPMVIFASASSRTVLRL